MQKDVFYVCWTIFTLKRFKNVNFNHILLCHALHAGVLAELMKKKNRDDSDEY